MLNESLVLISKKYILAGNYILVWFGNNTTLHLKKKKKEKNRLQKRNHLKKKKKKKEIIYNCHNKIDNRFINKY